MGIFGFGKNKVKYKEIYEIVMDHFVELGPPYEFGTDYHKMNYIKMLDKLDKWATENNFNDMRRAAISGEIENILRTTFKNTGHDDIIKNFYLKWARKIILQIGEE